jgi:hypothetical protein
VLTSRTAASAENGDLQRAVSGPSCAMAACISRFRVECSFLGFKLAVQPEIWPRIHHLPV